MLIREITCEDAAQYLDLLTKLDSETGYMMYQPGEREQTVEEIHSNIESIHNSASTILVAEESQELAGFISAERGFAKRISHDAYIIVGVLKKYWDRGVGTALFEELIRWCKKNSILRLELTVMTHNKNAISLYKKMGFKIEGIRKNTMFINNRFVDEYYMAKLLNNMQDSVNTSCKEDVIIKPLSDNFRVPYELLLMADPSRDRINSYIEAGTVHIALINELVVGVYVLINTSITTAEIVNIAVAEEYQGKGIGKLLVQDAMKEAKGMSSNILEIGTGNSSINQLGFYQRCGFRIVGVDKDFFKRNYPQEIIENGIVCRDMIRLRRDI